MNILVHPQRTTINYLKRLCKRAGIKGYSGLRKDELIEKIKILETRPCREAKLNLYSHRKGYSKVEEFWDNWDDKEKELKDAFGDRWLGGQIGQDDDGEEIFMSCVLDIDSVGEALGILMSISETVWIDTYNWE